MEFVARFPAVTAREAKFADDGESIMMLFRDGVPLGVMPSDAFHVAYVAVEPEAQSVRTVRETPVNKDRKVKPGHKWTQNPVVPNTEGPRDQVPGATAQETVFPAGTRRGDEVHRRHEVRL